MVASIRSREPAPAIYGQGIAPDLDFARFEISVPAGHRPGVVDPPARSPDAVDRSFLVLSAHRIADERSFVAALNRRLAAHPGRDCVGGVYVHGYRNSFADSLIHQAQIQADVDQHGAIVHFAWPASPSRLAYLRDFDMALASRDALARTIDLLAETEVREIGLVGNSLGAFLVMDTLWTMARSGRHDPALAKLDTVVLVAADIDPELFRRQAAAIAARGVRIVVVTSTADRALRLSAFLRGTRSRVGSLPPDAFAGLPVVILDATDLPVSDSAGHRLLARCPDLLALAREAHVAGEEALLREGRLRQPPGSPSVPEEAAAPAHAHVTVD
jgi:esterase/lipase superfamily enzyme